MLQNIKGLMTTYQYQVFGSEVKGVNIVLFIYYSIIKQ